MSTERNPRPRPLVRASRDIKAWPRADWLQLRETAGADDRRDNLATFGAVCFGLGMIVGIIVWAVLGR